MLPLVCNDAVAILFMFDLSRKSTLMSVKEWYRQVRGLNKVRIRALPRLLMSGVALSATHATARWRCVERVCLPGGHQVRYFRAASAGGAGGDHQDGAGRVRACAHAGQTDQRDYARLASTPRP